jgi:hypothetical protein
MENRLIGLVEDPILARDSKLFAKAGLILAGALLTGIITYDICEALNSRNPEPVRQTEVYSPQGQNYRINSF